MATEAVDIYVLKKNSPFAPIPNVVVKVYDISGVEEVTEGVTNSLGKASFLLPSGTSYQLRFYKFASAIKSPQLITVLPSPSTNNFNVYGDVFEHPMATDPRLCRASGFFRTSSGAVGRNVDIAFLARFSPLLLEGSAITTPREVIRTDKNGYAEIDLIRFGQYDAVVEGLEDTRREIHVPDSAWVNLGDLLFPRVVRVDYTGSDPIVVPVGTTVTVPVQVYTSDLRMLEKIDSDVCWAQADSTVVELSFNNDSIDIKGLKVGATSIEAIRRDVTVISIPDPGVAGSPLLVQVV
jgi:hypothetical protein